ncbi:MAG: nitronate monooxygenase family protein [Myxococcota bacterium]|jgi:NAD(P)H-dependent flavin oxidoreductase YrpB (nitropropane dioxygenase family)|nr:monooxygenase [Deltaproteobacteria bacterium]MCP4240301.1 nitronate monooxygenase [bacterium]MDP6244768.1 nitronate monooxygenase family protein [Myxococcota bacterium]MDP7076487.1 nitronate monooxygenase family protein [Myxococcota bacterium]MDP7298785.1 nitronate monooxygenase family protein [Myxococcota bacterium]
MRTPVCESFGLEYPIFALSHCRDVVAAVSRAGGMGVLGAIVFTPEELERELQWIDKNVDGKPYGVDVVIPAAYVGKAQGDLGKLDLEKLVPEEHTRFLEQLLDRYDVPPLPEDVPRFEGLLGWTASKGRALVDVAMGHPIKLLANALGPPPVDVIERAHAAGVQVAALVGRGDQALAQRDSGVDVIVAAGYEAGGHTGEVSTMVLVPEVVDAVAPLPVLAAGGIGSGRQMAAAMTLGAQGVWMGSIWLTTHENDWEQVIVERMLSATSSDTVRSRCVTGKPARMLRSGYTEAWDSAESPGTLPMPLQFLAGAEAEQRIRRAIQAGSSSGAELSITPVGQIVGSMKQVRPVRQVVSDLVDGYLDAMERMARLMEETE